MCPVGLKAILILPVRVEKGCPSVIFYATYPHVLTGMETSRMIGVSILSVSGFVGCFIDIV